MRRATYKELVHIHPMGKFLAIKTIVFFSWWQVGLVQRSEKGKGWSMGGLDRVANVAKCVRAAHHAFSVVAAHLVSMCSAADGLSSSPLHFDRGHLTWLFFGGPSTLEKAEIHTILRRILLRRTRTLEYVSNRRVVW